MLRPERLSKIYCIFSRDLLETVVSTLQAIGAVHIYDIKEESPFLNPVNINYKDEVSKMLESIKMYKNELESKAGRNKLERLFGPMYVGLEKRDKKIKDVINEAKNLLEEINNKYGEINAKNAKEIKKGYYSRLLSVKEHLDNINDRVKALEKFGATKYTVSFAGFTSKEDISKVLNAIDVATNGKSAFEIKDAVSEDNSPTKLENPKFIKPFEILTENYGMPFYNGIDPTFILAISFTLIFGLMFPDVGYGIMLVVLGLLVYFITRKTTKFIRNLNIILVYSGISAAFFGLLFGEFFGGFIQINPFLYEPAKDILTILFISVIIGILHISIGLISGIVVKKHAWHNIGLLISLWSIIFFMYTKNFSFILLFAMSLVMLIYTKGFLIIEEVASLFMHILSYLRIGILILLSVIISRLLLDAYLGLPKNFIGAVFGILLMIVGILFSFAIGVVSVFIQSLRLHWLEFFSIYEFSGKKFEPFGYKKEYLYSL